MTSAAIWDSFLTTQTAALPYSILDYSIIMKMMRIKKVLFSKWTWITRRSYTTETTTIHLLQIMTIEPDITGVKQHSLRAQYFGSACLYSRKLICSFFPKKDYVVLGQLLRLYLDRGMRLGKVHRAIRLNYLPMLQATLQITQKNASS